MIFKKYEDIEEFVSLNVFNKSLKLYEIIVKHRTLFVTPTLRESIQFEYEMFDYYLEFEVFEEEIHVYSNINGIEFEGVVTENEIILLVDDYIEYLKKEGLNK